MELKKTQEWTAEIVANRFEECVSVLKRLPNGISMGCKTFWPEIKYTPEEIARQEKKKFTTVTPSPAAIDRAEECLSWITWVGHGERNLIWLRAQRVSWRGIQRETGYPRTSAQRYWTIALEKVADILESREIPCMRE